MKQDTRRDAYAYLRPTLERVQAELAELAKEFNNRGLGVEFLAMDRAFNEVYRIRNKLHAWVMDHEPPPA